MFELLFVLCVIGKCSEVTEQRLDDFVLRVGSTIKDLCVRWSKVDLRYTMVSRSIFDFFLIHLSAKYLQKRAFTIINTK